MSSPHRLQHRQATHITGRRRAPDLPTAAEPPKARRATQYGKLHSPGLDQPINNSKKGEYTLIMNGPDQVSRSMIPSQMMSLITAIKEEAVLTKIFVGFGLFFVMGFASVKENSEMKIPILSPDVKMEITVDRKYEWGKCSDEQLKNTRYGNRITTTEYPSFQCFVVAAPVGGAFDNFAEGMKKAGWTLHTMVPGAQAFVKTISGKNYYVGHFFHKPEGVISDSYFASVNRAMMFVIITDKADD
jgi:hypothetical protein